MRYLRGLGVGKKREMVHTPTTETSVDLGQPLEFRHLANQACKYSAYVLKRGISVSQILTKFTKPKAG